LGLKGPECIAIYRFSGRENVRTLRNHLGAGSIAAAVRLYRSAEFPAALLWKFRIAAIGMQAIMWTTLGLLFGNLAERSLRAGSRMANVSSFHNAV